MLIAQITDIHVGFERGNPREPNRERLERVLDALTALRPRPDLLLATGDLTEHGDIQSYRWLAERLERLPFPVHYALGNHDLRGPFREVFPDQPGAGGFVQYAIEAGPLRCLVLDTLEEGRHGGGFCAARAAWLDERLSEQPERPTLLVMHHPPIGIGIAWMDPDPAEPWIARLAAVLDGRDNVAGIVTGHVHRAVTASWAGVPVSACPATAPEVGLNLTAIHPDAPDERALIVAGEPGFALHRWSGERLVTHFGAPAGTVLARFGPALQPMIRGMIAERAGNRSPAM